MYYKTVLYVYTICTQKVMHVFLLVFYISDNLIILIVHYCIALFTTQNMLIKSFLTHIVSIIEGFTNIAF